MVPIRACLSCMITSDVLAHNNTHTHWQVEEGSSSFLRPCVTIPYGRIRAWISDLIEYRRMIHTSVYTLYHKNTNHYIGTLARRPNTYLKARRGRPQRDGNRQRTKAVWRKFNDFNAARRDECISYTYIHSTHI